MGSAQIRHEWGRGGSGWPNLKPAKGQQLAPQFGREWSPGTHGIHVCLAHPLGWDEETPSLWSPQLATGHDAGSPGESLKHCVCFGTLVGIQTYRKGYALRDLGTHHATTWTCPEVAQKLLKSRLPLWETYF